MRIKELQLPTVVEGRIYLSPMPGRWEPFVVNEVEILKHKINIVVRLSSTEETRERAPDYMNAITKKHILWTEINYPINNYSIPQDFASFDRLIETIKTMLIGGKIILIHCGAGIGRTGIVAACLLMKFGYNYEGAIKAVKESGSFPETKEQVIFLKEYWMCY